MTQGKVSINSTSIVPTSIQYFNADKCLLLERRLIGTQVDCLRAGQYVVVSVQLCLRRAQRRNFFFFPLAAVKIIRLCHEPVSINNFWL